MPIHTSCLRYLCRRRPLAASSLSARPLPAAIYPARALVGLWRPPAGGLGGGCPLLSRASEIGPTPAATNAINVHIARVDRVADRDEAWRNLLVIGNRCSTRCVRPRSVWSSDTIRQPSACHR